MVARRASQRFEATRIAGLCLFARNLCLLVLLLLIGTGCGGRHDPTVGTPASDFLFTLPDGSQKKLSDFRGKKVLIVFWSTWCDVCQHELAPLSALQDELKESVTILGIVIRDQKQKALTFLAEAKPSFLNGIADTKPIADKYKVDGVPEIFFIDEQGILLPLLDVDGVRKVKLVGGKPWHDPTFYSQLRTVSR
jgi:cytochrome c biogenesis protein CcmG/thiol:disulfide interchange protein DsbE